jgi:hypothetical protein
MAFDFPNSPSVGQAYLNYTWDGEKWVSAVQGAIYVNDAPPSAPVGSLWWESDTGILYVLYYDGNSTQWVAIAGSTAAPVIRGYLSGLGISTAGGSNVVTFAPGVAVDSTNVALLSSAGSVRNIANWSAPGSGGLLDTGGVGAVNTWYHFYIIKRLDTGVVDFCMSLSAVAPTFGVNIPAAYTLFRRIGAAKLNASAQWILFVQDGDTFQWGAVAMDVNGAAAVLRTLSTPPGVRCMAIGTVACLLATTAGVDNPSAVLISDPSIPDQAPNVIGALSFINYPGATQVGGIYSCMTNTASQVRSRLAQSTANTSLYMGTSGWIDRRGRDA